MALPFIFRTTNQYFSALRIFTQHLSESRSGGGNKVIDIVSSQEYMGQLEVHYGITPKEHYSLVYTPTDTKAYDIKVCIEESDIFKGTGAGLAKWVELFITIMANDVTEAKNVMTCYLDDAISYTKLKDHANISIQIFDRQLGWRFISELPLRPMDTIYIDPEEKRQLVDDVSQFIASEKEYTRFGIPYKRCYLFHGTAGSGKSSLIFAIASLLKRSIAIFNFSTEMNDTTFISAISNLPSERILVFEDIDAIFTDRSPIDTNNVSFSALLNVLDGMCRKESMLVFITTNHISKLDPALLRPGRIDYIMKFTYASMKQMRQMYDMFRREKGSDKEFTKFYNIVKNKKINMSLVQKFLFEKRNTPEARMIEDDREDELRKLVGEHEEKNPIGII